MPSPFYLPFDYAHQYPTYADGIVIPVSLLSGQTLHKAVAAVDPGAGVCLLRKRGTRCHLVPPFSLFPGVVTDAMNDSSPVKSAKFWGYGAK